MLENKEFNDLDSELTVDDIKKYEVSQLIELYLEKVNVNNVEQIKYYLGMVYFVALAILTITLFV